MDILLGLFLGGITGIILYKMFIMKAPHASTESKGEELYLNIFGWLVTIGGAIFVAYLVIGA